MNSLLRIAALAVAGAVVTVPAQAAEDASCRTVRFADVGWSDIAAKTGVASVVLEALGYRTSVTVASIPVAMNGMKNGQIDVFLGYWQPSMTSVVAPFVMAGHIDVLERPNLAGARYTLAVPAYLYDQGLKSFSDIARFHKQLDGRIHGLESGNDSNALIRSMIREDRYGLKRFSLVESSEAAMLAEVQRASRARKAIVFLGWEPHPMNVQFKMNYLSGGDEVFGPNQGEAVVYTAVAAGYREKCPNVAAFLARLRFTTDMESSIMGRILARERPNAAARSFLVKNPTLLAPWLEGVTTHDGRDGLAAVTAAVKK